MPQDISSTGFALVILLVLLIFVFFYLTLYRTLSLVRPENRKIQPFTVWLLFIPGFKMIWSFFVVTGISNSIREELLSRDYEVTDRPTYLSGILYSIALCFDLLIFIIPKDQITFFGIAGLLQIIFFVQYWNKVSWYKNLLQTEITKEADR
ncbi:hypothetical protein [Arcticibacter sp. MXS-1]|uniref:hypothetical protein n=1 Tax=Arcticibacter sp. MXS-1 TaxID=3341726 RepID=UPI0035A8332E